MASQDVVGLSFPFRKEDGEFPRKERNADVVKSNVLSLFSTELGERVMRLGCGSNLRSLVFESTGGLLEARIRRSVATAIANNEPRAKVLSINIVTNNTVVTVDILYEAYGLRDTVSLAVPRI